MTIVTIVTIVTIKGPHDHRLIVITDKPGALGIVWHPVGSEPDRAAARGID